MRWLNTELLCPIRREVIQYPKPLTKLFLQTRMALEFITLLYYIILYNNITLTLMVPPVEQSLHVGQAIKADHFKQFTTF